MNYTIFGESHGPAIGVTITGLPAGFELDLEEIQRQMDRRVPGKTPWSTPRKEGDKPEIISGFFEGKTTGTPLTALIANADTRSRDYGSLPHIPRPSHGDYAGFVRYNGAFDYRGGGHFSGRLTAPLVFAGAVARQLLAGRGIQIGAHISSIYGISDEISEDYERFLTVSQKAFPVLDDAKGEEMQGAILEAKEEGDSLGGAIECAVLGARAGFGDPDLGKNVEGIFSKHLFAIPAVKAVSFGAGVAFALMRGSEANDPWEMAEGKPHAKTNHAGGVNGGITNGMPIVFEVTFRPTPSIAIPQESVDLRTGEKVELTVQGRHDPCIVPRAVPVVEAAAALAMCEVLGV